MTNAAISTITVSAQPATVGNCGLCLRPGSGLSGAVVVSHGAGTVARFDACEFCERAIRRLMATAPGLSQAGAGAVIHTAAPVEIVSAAVTPVEEEPLGPTVVIQE